MKQELAYEIEAAIRDGHIPGALRRLTASDLMGIYCWQMDGTISHADDTFLAMLGYNRADLAAGRLNWRVMTPPEFRATDERALSRFVVTGTYPRTVKEFIRKDGSCVPVLIGSVALDASRQNGLAFAIDITEQKEEERRLREAFEREHHIAQTLQHSLLMTPPAEAFPGITVKAIYESAYDDALIGGDFFDIFAVAENRVAVVVGDATGKGLNAAMFTAEVKFALRAFLRECASPAIALERLNNTVVDAERLDRAHMGSTYVALACAVIDTETGEVVGSAAGMESPFVLRAATDEVVELQAGGMLLGVEPRAPYEMQSLQMEHGDILLLSTDGITEARGPWGTFFGYDGLVRAARETASMLPSLAHIGEAIMQRAKTFAGRKLRDDVCLLLVRRR